MPEDQRMVIMERLKKKNYTHECPECKKLAYCAMTDGKSISACWCRGLSTVDIKEKYDECLCKRCLTKGN